MHLKAAIAAALAGVAILTTPIAAANYSDQDMEFIGPSRGIA